ncbi:MAG: (d)CMP kinase [Anaerolineae bacterium]
MKKITIAIDGPAASGKSTVGGALAARLGYTYFDTGVMYRAVTWAALERSIAVDDKDAVTRLACELLIEVTPPTVMDKRQYSVFADKVDITWAIREPRVNEHVSLVSCYPGVRTALTEQQRRIGSAGGVVMVGRDIGTVVLPKAELKIYLDASLEERINRRLKEALVRGLQLTYQAVQVDLEKRDRIDSTRATAPLSIAPDAIVIDTTELSVAQVVSQIESLALPLIGSSGTG